MNEDCIVNCDSYHNRRIPSPNKNNNEKLNKKLSLDRKKLLIKKQLNNNKFKIGTKKNETSQSVVPPVPPPLTLFLNSQNKLKQQNNNSSKQIKTKQRRYISNRIRNETNFLLNNIIFDSMIKNNNDLKLRK